jgi:hypothetical protein
MKSCVVRDRKLTVAAACGLVSLLCLGACEDKRVSQLDTGITRDSAVNVFTNEVKGGVHDSLPNVYIQERYLINAKNYDVLYFTPDNEKATKDSVPWRKLTPLVFVDNKLVAKKWSQWDSISKANKIPLKKR